jgi:F-type H+-transporting ATPase subunit gamma
MPSLKAIRKRIASTKSTQKITRAMKMVAAARLRRAQQRISELRPFALKTADVLSQIALRVDPNEPAHPLLARREEKEVLIVVVSGDRGLAGAFNSNVIRATERLTREMQAAGKNVHLVTLGRKAREYFKRRNVELMAELPGVTEKVDIAGADELAAFIIDLYVGAQKKTESKAHDAEDAVEGGVHHPDTTGSNKPLLDAVYFVFNEFKSAMTQNANVTRLLPVEPPAVDEGGAQEFLYEPNQKALLDRLLPLYVQISVYRGLLESVASFFGAQMTAMDAATGNAKEMIARLTLDYNRARQAAITKELMEIIGGAEALK